MEKKQKLYQQKLEELLSKPINFFNDDLKNNIPKTSGIYRIFDKNSINHETIYLGKSKDLKRRVVNNHFKGSSKNSTLRRKLSLTLSSEEITLFLNQKCNVQFIEIEENNLSYFEHYFIAMLCPKHND